MTESTTGARVLSGTPTPVLALMLPRLGPGLVYIRCHSASLLGRLGGPVFS
jgi:hypothetical protein